MEQDASTLPRPAPNSVKQVKHHLESTITPAGKEIPTDLICFSHLRWHFVYQRPQHLMSRFAHTMRVFFLEEPVFTEQAAPFLEIGTTPSGVTVVVPHLPAHLDNIGVVACQRKLLDQLCDEYKIHQPILWYYTPMSGAFSAHLGSARVVYDCMDELSGFRAAPPELLQQEQDLFRRADVVFTGGYSLYEAKRPCHPHVHAFPSGIDADHFRRARGRLPEPADQALISRPRIGHYAVLDERLDTALLDEVAKARPNWELILVGPVVKIDPEELPKRANIHYLGPKSYDELPAYLAGWDMAMMPFALNEATRFISPTKTPEYLAAGKPVVSTPITDVVQSYGDAGLVRIARDPAEFVAAIDQQLREAGRRRTWLKKVDRALQEMSWDRTWAEMKALIA
jgi:UDP-galactopyranose mutase